MKSEDGIFAGDFNAHSHPEQSVYVELVDPAWDLATWCRHTIYKYSTSMTPEIIRFGCRRAFSRMLLFGVTSVMVSFYCHNKLGNLLDKAVIEAANDVGIRLIFGRMNYDIVNPSAYPEKKASQESYFESPDEAERNFVELMEECESDTVMVAPSLHSFHANTLDGIIHGINLGAKYNRPVQLHLSEDEGDVKLSLEQFGARPVEVLVRLLDEGKIARLDHVFLSDCVWTDDNEKDLIRSLNMKVVLNARMNDRVKAGRADLKAFLRRGIPVYVGTDGEASNDDLSIVNEREYLASVNSLEDPSVIVKPFDFAGMDASGDYKVLRGDKVVDVFVGGRKVVENGRLLAANYKEENNPLLGGVD